MHGPDGTDYPNRIVYKEVIKPERLVYVHSDDKENDPNQFHVTVLLEDLGERTRLTMRAQFASAAILDRVIKEFKADVGAIQTLDRLEAELEKMNKGLQTAKYNGVK